MQPNWNLIGIHGSIGAGKNLFTQLLDWSAAGVSEDFKEWCEPDRPYKKGLYYQIHAFADPLKEDLARLTHTQLIDWEDRTFKTTALATGPKFLRGLTGRQAMETYGEGLRKVWPNVWIDRVIEDWDFSKPTIFTDVRHLNEREFIKSQDGVMIGIQRYQTPSQWVWYLSGKKLHLYWSAGLLNLHTFKRYLESPLEPWASEGLTEPIIRECLDRLAHESGSQQLSCDYWVKNKGTTDSLLKALSSIVFT